MVEVIKDLPEVCVDTIAATRGEELEISANITDASQIDLVMQKFLYSPYGLDDPAVVAQAECLLRLTKSINGKFIDNVVEIGKAPRFMNGNTPFGMGKE